MPASRVNVRLDTSLETLLERAPPCGPPRVLATVVSTAGSTYRKPGARMLIMADGSYLGLLSGGCLEADLKLHAEQVMDSGKPRAVEYDMRGPDDILFGIGAGCEGAMRVLLEPSGALTMAGAALEESGRNAAAGQPALLICVHESHEVPLGTYAKSNALPEPLVRAAAQSLGECASRGCEWSENGRRARAFVQFLAPVPHLLICGAGPDSQPVESTARRLGWRVTVIDHRPVYAVPERFPAARVLLGEPRKLRDLIDVDQCHAAVVMSHHLPSDVAYLRSLAQSDKPAYIGLLGPEARRARVTRELGSAAEALRFRVRGPVGMDIGAATPEGIALAIVAEIHAWLAGRETRASAYRASIA